MVQSPAIYFPPDALYGQDQTISSGSPHLSLIILFHQIHCLCQPSCLWYVFGSFIHFLRLSCLFISADQAICRFLKIHFLYLFYMTLMKVFDLETYCLKIQRNSSFLKSYLSILGQTVPIDLQIWQSLRIFKLSYYDPDPSLLVECRLITYFLWFKV